jgi:hypothetical protein
MIITFESSNWSVKPGNLRMGYDQFPGILPEFPGQKSAKIFCRIRSSYRDDPFRPDPACFSAPPFEGSLPVHLTGWWMPAGSISGRDDSSVIVAHNLKK